MGKLAIALLIGYAVAVVACAVLQRSLMYFPAPDLPTPAQAGVPEMRPVALGQIDGRDCISWYAPPDPGRATIIYFQGNAGSIAHRGARVRPFLDAGYGVLLVGYSGYGGNPGSPSEQALLDDGRQALAFTATQKIPLSQTVLLGESLGSAIAVQLASRTKVGAVMLEAPFTSAAEAGQRAYPFLPVKWLIFDRFDSLALIGRVTAPLLLVHGEDDNVSPVDLGRKLFAAANQPKEAHFLPRAGHNDLPLYGLADIELEFLKRHVPSGQPSSG